MPGTDPVLIVRGTSRRFGYRYVIKDVSFDLHSGHALLLIGHSGATGSGGWGAHTSWFNADKAAAIAVGLLCAVHYFLDVALCTFDAARDA
jgi:ABC-type branched-subunit amino acid transport system ATPase component